MLLFGGALILVVAVLVVVLLAARNPAKKIRQEPGKEESPLVDEQAGAVYMGQGEVPLSKDDASFSFNRLFREGAVDYLFGQGKQRAETVGDGEGPMLRDDFRFSFKTLFQKGALEYLFGVHIGNSR